MNNARSNSQPTRIVIIGGGFGGAYAARRLGRVAARRNLHVTLLNRTNYFVFYPLLVEAGTGSLEPRHAVVSLRQMLNGVDFRMAEAVGVDFERRVVRADLVGADHVQDIAFDHLVFAPGSVTALPPVPGLAEYGFEMKSMADAVALRDRAIQQLEKADAIDDAQARRRMLRFVIVGGSYTGVEVAGEFQAFLHTAAKNYRHINRHEELKVTLVEIGDRILGALDRDLADYAADRLRGRGVELLLGESVREIGETFVNLRSGPQIPTETCIWTAGIAPAPIIAEAGLPTDDKGYIRCTPDLRVTGHDRVWAIGDCAVNPAPDGTAYPPTAQHAVQMGYAVADRILAAIAGRGVEPFVYQSRGTLAALGCRSAVAKVMGFKLSGFVAWWLYRTVYLLKMPGWGRRFRIAVDWTLDLMFGRDYVQLGAHRARRHAPPSKAN